MPSDRINNMSEPEAQNPNGKEPEREGENQNANENDIVPQHPDNSSAWETLSEIIADLDTYDLNTPDSKPKHRKLRMEDFNSESDSDYTSYWRDWVSERLSLSFPSLLFTFICSCLRCRA